jgi:4'-phosphopantetheinyl transferase
LLPGFTPVRSSSGRRRSASQFKFAADGDRYVVGRARLRQLLARYLDADPAGLRLGVGEHGKPYVDGPNRIGLEFNASHSRDVLVVAVARERAVGVDVEWRHRDLDVDGLAARLYTDTERSTLDRLTGERRQSAFVTLWTRKEAILKAVGTGLTVPPDLIEAVPGRAVRVLTPDLPRAWSIAGVATQPGYRAAVAITPPGGPLPRRAVPLDAGR